MPSGTAVLVDTGPLVALFDRDDHHHTRCVEVLKHIRQPLVTVWPVLTEAMFLLAFSLEAQETLWEFVERGGLRIGELTSADLPGIRSLMRKYRNRPMDLADAALVHLAERERLRTVFTLDHGDFKVYRTTRRIPFTLLPETLA
jgi:predicted nucleic acid-binding protein